MIKDHNSEEFLSMQVIFRKKSSQINFLKQMSSIESCRDFVSNDIINNEVEYIDFIENIIDNYSTVLGKYKN